MRAVGRSVLRKEGISKVTGQAVYTADMTFDNCLYGRTVRSTVPHARIKGVRFGPEVAWEQFVIVLPKDIPGKNGVTLIDSEQPYLADGEIRHIAEPLLLIAHS